MQKNVSLRSLIAFVIVGGLATGLQYVCMALLIWAIDCPVVLASGLGFIVSAVANYLLNARVTFRSKRSHRTTAPRFIITAAAGLLINSVILAALTAAGMHAAPAQILTTLCVLIWNYIVNALWTFKQPAP